MKIISVKAVLILFSISLFANSLFAQKYYVTVNAQYGLNMGSFWDYENHSNTIVNTTDTWEKFNSSLGKGLSTGAAFGYMFTENIGAELGISYLLGDKSEYNSNDQNQNITKNTIYSSKMLQINPSFIITAGLKKINPYAKLGLVVGSGSVLQEYNENNKGTITLQKTKNNGGLALGLNAGIGVLYSLNTKMSLFGQLNMMDMAYGPTKGEITEYTINGADQLANTLVSDKKFEYVDSYTIDASNPPSNSEPSKQIKTNYPFNNWGFNLGVKYSF